jgi:hypothetical protein
MAFRVRLHREKREVHRPALGVAVAYPLLSARVIATNTRRRQY